MAYAINLLLVIFACGKNVNAKHQKSLFLKQRSFGFGRPSKTNKLDIRSKEPAIKLKSVAKLLPSPKESIIRKSAAKSLPSVISKFLLFYLLSYILYDNNNINNNN